MSQTVARRKSSAKFNPMFEEAPGMEGCSHSCVAKQGVALNHQLQAAVHTQDRLLLGNKTSEVCAGDAITQHVHHRVAQQSRSCCHYRQCPDGLKQALMAYRACNVG